MNSDHSVPKWSGGRPRPTDETDEEKEDTDEETDDQSLNRKREPKPQGKQYAPGGGLRDYFFPCTPKWTVGNALNRLLTKVKNNPNHAISVQKFVKDSCKGNLKVYFTQIRDSLGKGDSVVMAEVAYLSFLQLSQGENPLVRILPPKNRPRTKAAAVSNEGVIKLGYAYKDYLIQVTKHGFELMNAKMSYDEEQSPPTKKPRKGSGTTITQPTTVKMEEGVSGSTFGNNLTDPSYGGGGGGGPSTSSLSSSSQQLSVPDLYSLPAHTPQQPFVLRLTEQEQETANSMMFFLKASVHGLLATIHNLRTENQSLRKENLTYKYYNEVLSQEYRALKNQLFILTGQLQDPSHLDQHLQHLFPIGDSQIFTQKLNVVPSSSMPQNEEGTAAMMGSLMTYGGTVPFPAYADMAGLSMLQTNMQAHEGPHVMESAGGNMDMGGGFQHETAHFTPEQGLCEKQLLEK